jgi:hypothetical protein
MPRSISTLRTTRLIEIALLAMATLWLVALAMRLLAAAR